MISPEVLEQFIKDRYGSLLTKDPESELGWKSWSAENTQALCEWLSLNSNGHDPNGVTCYNQTEAAHRVGVSVPKFQEWLRRRDNPIPHVRDGRMIRIPEFLLMEWLREEAGRHVNGKGEKVATP